MKINWFLAFLSASLTLTILAGYQLYQSHKVLHACELAGLDPKDCCYDEDFHQYVNCSMLMARNPVPSDFVINFTKR